MKHKMRLSVHTTLRFCFRAFPLLERLPPLWLTSPHLPSNGVHTCTWWCGSISNLSLFGMGCFLHSLGALFAPIYIYICVCVCVCVCVCTYIYTDRHIYTYKLEKIIIISVFIVFVREMIKSSYQSSKRELEFYLKNWHIKNIKAMTATNLEEGETLNGKRNTVLLQIYFVSNPVIGKRITETLIAFNRQFRFILEKMYLT